MLFVNFKILQAPITVHVDDKSVKIVKFRCQHFLPVLQRNIFFVPKIVLACFATYITKSSNLPSILHLELFQTLLLSRFLCPSKDSSSYFNLKSTEGKRGQICCFNFLFPIQVFSEDFKLSITISITIISSPFKEHIIFILL